VLWAFIFHGRPTFFLEIAPMCHQRFGCGVLQVLIFATVGLAQPADPKGDKAELAAFPGKAPPRDLTPAELDSAWADLAKDGAKAYDAWGTLTAAPKQATTFLGKHVHPVKAIPAEQLAPLLTALGSERLGERDKAALELEAIGDLAEPALRKAAAGNLPLEHKRRINLLLEKFPAPITVEQRRNLRAVEALEYIGTAEAQQILTTLAKGAPGARLTREAKAALDRLAKKAKNAVT
jgi:hypothetical protein